MENWTPLKKYKVGDLVKVPRRKTLWERTVIFFRPSLKSRYEFDTFRVMATTTDSIEPIWQPYD